MEKRQANVKVIIMIVAAVITALIVGMIIFTNSPAQKLKKQLDLGQKYLSELHYEEAVAVFTQAFRMDPSNADARDMLVLAYSKWGDALVLEGSYEEAISVLQQGYDECKDDRLIAKMNSVEEAYLNEKLGEKGLSSIRESEFIDQIFKLFNEENYEEIYNLCNSDDFKALRDKYSGTTGYYGELNDYTPDGEGLLIYGEGVKKTSVLYVGSLENGMRSGKGMAVYWLKNDNADPRKGYYIGNWENDIQNGEATQFYYGNEPRKFVGTAKNGLAEGDFVEWFLDGIESGQPGRTWAYEYYCKDGVPQKLGETFNYSNNDTGISFTEEAMSRAVNASNTFLAWHAFAGLRCKDCEDFPAGQGPRSPSHPWAGWKEERKFTFANAD